MIETKQDAVKYLREVEPINLIDRLEQLCVIVNGDPYNPHEESYE